MFFTKDNSIEANTKRCNDKYHDFKLHLSQAHYESYFEFKKFLNQDFNLLRKKIGEASSEENLLVLLNRFEKQLDFILEYPFSAPQEVVKKFFEEVYPYSEQQAKILEPKSNLKPI